MATSINISTAINDSLKYINYKITLLNSSGVFGKYKVNDFTIKADALRYYDISSIFRLWNKDYDKGTGNDNTIQEVSFAVAQLWTASTVGEQVTYSKIETETILITKKYVDFLRYLNGFYLWTNSCDSHYVAFDTDKPIDKLMEADVYYVSKSFKRTQTLVSDTYDYGDSKENYVGLNYTQKAENRPNNIFQGHKYTWDRIQSVDDFITTENIQNEDTKKGLQGKKWILRFCETEYNKGASLHGVSISTGTAVSEVSILRLKFETAGTVYNMGVVDNKQSGDEKPGNVPTVPDDIPWWVWLIISLLVLVLLVLFVKPVAEIVLLIFKAVWAIVSAPFRLIIWLCRKIFNRGAK